MSLNLSAPETPAILETKVCAQCKESLLIVEFGVSSSRRDGLNPHCKQCCRDRTNANREVRKEKDKAQRKAYQAQMEANRASREGIKPHPPGQTAADYALRRLDRMYDLSRGVENALQGREWGFENLKRELKAGEDDLCDVLAELWDAGRVRIERVGEGRVYSLKR
jgi:hypothetical protein